jgi:UDP-N-acetylmuramoylalanine-D-glutamate ligase
MRQRVVLIAGGDGKGQDFARCSRRPATRGRVLIGRDRERIAEP